MTQQETEIIGGEKGIKKKQILSFKCKILLTRQGTRREDWNPCDANYMITTILSGRLEEKVTAVFICHRACVLHCVALES